MKNRKNGFGIFLLVILLLVSSAQTRSNESNSDIILDVPYRNQVLNYPYWTNNWASCGYTSVLMNLLYLDALPSDISEQPLIEMMYRDCSVTTAEGYVIFDYSKVKEFCKNTLPDQDLEVKTFSSDMENNILQSLNNGSPVTVGTMIFGDAGHVIEIVGCENDCWIVHDSANSWGKEYWPPGGIQWENAAYVRYPKGSFTMLYGVTITSDINRDYAGKMVEQSPGAIICDDETATLWVRIKNTGKKDWKNNEVRLGGWGPADRNCGLVSSELPNYQVEGSTNRFAMLQEKVEPGQESLFAVKVATNSHQGVFQERFKLVCDGENGQWFGPTISWQVDCRQTTKPDNSPPITQINPEDTFCYHRGVDHLHTTYSDGNLSIDEMASWGKKMGLEYMVISDHVEFFTSKDIFVKYVEEINEVAKKYGICLVAGLEYSMINFDGVICDPHDSTVHIVCLGYNRANEIIVPEFIPYDDRWKNVSPDDLIDWHWQNKLPVIACHPTIVGKNGINTASLIEKNKFGDITKLSALEFFDIGLDSMPVDIFFDRLINPDKVFSYNYALYKNHLLPAGIGVSASNDYHGKLCKTDACVVIDDGNKVSINIGDTKLAEVNAEDAKLIQTLDRAKKTIVTDFNSLTVGEVCEAFFFKRTIASRYHEYFDYIKINDVEWAPGKWGNDIITDRLVKLSLSVQFHSEEKEDDQTKMIFIYRNGALVCAEQRSIDIQDRLEFEFVDNVPSYGIQSYNILVTGMEENERAREKIISSPIYVLTKDQNLSVNEPQIVDDTKSVLIIQQNFLHLGDGFYDTPLNVGFEDTRKNFDFGKVGSWRFEMPEDLLKNIGQTALIMKITGAEIHPGNIKGNPIYLNGIYVGDCIVKDHDLKNNGQLHSFMIPKEVLQAGKNELMIRSMSHWIGNSNYHKSNIDFDDFELAEICIAWDTRNSDNKANVQTLYVADEAQILASSGTDGFTDEEKEESDDMIKDFYKKGGKFYKNDDEIFNLTDQLMQPLLKCVDEFKRYDNIQYFIYDSPVLDVTALPDGRLLIPTGLIGFENEDLPESMLFPILSAMIQADMGISHDQANRTDWTKILATVGYVAGSISGVDAVQMVGVGFMVAAAISLKVECEDYYIADAMALDKIKEMGMDEDDAFSFLDALTTFETKNPKKQKVFYLFSPTAAQRLRALMAYHQTKYCFDIPIKPEEFDWDKVFDKEK